MGFLKTLELRPTLPPKEDAPSKYLLISIRPSAKAPSDRVFLNEVIINFLIHLKKDSA